MTATIRNRRSTSHRAARAGRPPLSLAARMADGFRRRFRLWSAWLRGQATQPPAEAAFLWLYRHAAAEGLASRLGESEADPLLTAAAAETVANLGLPAVTGRWLDWLASLQDSSGAIRTGDGNTPLATAWFVRACLAGEIDEPAQLRPFHAAAQWLVDFVGLRNDSAGATLRIDRAHPVGRETADAHQPHWPLGFLEGAAALRRAGEWFEFPAWRALTVETVERLNAAPAPSQWTANVERRAAWADALLDLGCRDAAAELLRPTRAAQRPSGAVATAADGARISSATLAHLAACWYRLGWRDEADRIMAWLRRRQQRAGGFPAGWLAETEAPAGPGDPWAAKRYLDAIQLQVQAAFDATGQQLPDSIDPDDGRVEAVRLWAAKLPGGAQVADVGCGKGRFLRHLAGWDPSMRLVGVDPSPSLLASLPHSAAPCPGRLTHIPLASDSLDGALAVESLEHSLLPQVAVGELCRVIRPGGRVLIVEKDRRHQALSEHEPWEQWLSPHQLTDWLGHFCGEISVARVCHLEGRGGSRLFFAISGVKRP